MHTDKKVLPKKKKEPKKKPTSYAISDSAKALLKKVSDAENRSMTNMLETLIIEAAKKAKIE